MKILLWIISTIICICIGIIPETVMYFIWNALNPVEFAERFLTIALFVIFGGSLSVGFAMIGFILFVTATKAISEA